MARDHTKMKELILYISEKCFQKPNWGATWLNKILFFSDFIAYAKHGASITGEDYQKEAYGPIPRYLLEAREQLEEEGLIVIKQKETLKGTQHRVVPVGRDANLSVFSAEDIAIVDCVMEQLKDVDAETVSGMSHKFYGWQITKTGETIPYETVYLKEPSPEDPPEIVKQAIDRLRQ